MSLLCVLNAATTRIQAAQRGRIARRSAAPHRESAPWAPATPPKPLAADASPSLASVLGSCNPQAALAPLGSLHVFGGAPSVGSGILPPPFPPPPPAPPPAQHNLAPPAEAPPPIQIPGFHASSPPMTRALSDGCVPSPHTAYHARAPALAEPHHHHHHHHRAPSFPHNVYNSQPSTPEQHREQLLTAIVIDRLCAWGEHRAASEWPAGLVGPGPMPALVDALLATRARSLTLPQLITAIKERTGGGPAGRALDMLNLKAYVRCFPSLFYLHSGRTAAGRPLDAVELRPCAGLPPLPSPGLAMTRAERHRVAVGIATSAWSPANGGAGGGRPHPHHHHQPCAPVPPSCANTLYDRLQPLSAHGQPVSPLQPKDLFGAAASPRAGFAPCAAPAPALSLGPLGDAPGAAAARWPPHCSPPSFSIFDGPAAHAPAPAAPADAAQADAGEQQPAALLAQLSELLTPCGDELAAEEPLLAKEPLLRSLDSSLRTDSSRGSPPPSCRAEAEARRLFVQRHGLGALFDRAVDRAMQFNVTSPVEFVAQELLRSSAAAAPNGLAYA